LSPPQDVIPIPAPPSPVVSVPAPRPVSAVPAVVASTRLPLLLPAVVPAVAAVVSTPPIIPVQKSKLAVPATVIANRPKQPTPPAPKAASKHLPYIATPPTEHDPPAPPPVTKLPSLFRQPSPPPEMVHNSPPHVQRRFEASRREESPFPERVRQSVTFAASPSPVRAESRRTWTNRVLLHRR
jgi:hypothetical protein